MHISEEQLLDYIDEFLDSNKGARHLEFEYGLTQEEVYGKHSLEKAKIFASYQPCKGSKGLIRFVYGNICDEADFRSTAYHEIYGHYGILTFTGNEKRRLLEAISDSRHSLGMIKYWAIIDKHYLDEDESIKAEEMFCLISESCTEKSSKSKFFEKIWNDVIINKKRLLMIQDLEIICDAVAYGIRTGEREQQIFPKNDRSQYRFEGDEEKQHHYKIAISMLNINLELLKNDFRFSNHTLDELKRIAFYREIFILEKENVGLNSNATEFDLKMADRKNAANLPEISPKNIN